MFGTASGFGSYAGVLGTATGAGSYASFAGTASGAGSYAGMGGTAAGFGSQAGTLGTAIGAGSYAVDGSVALGAGATATAANSVALGNNSVADQDNTVSVGTPGSERRIVNVADGIHGYDAVNMRQLGNLASRVDRVGALAAAMSGLAPLDYDPEQPTQVAVGVGTYAGQSAVAIGLYHYGGGKDVLLNAGFAMASSEKMARAGVTWRIGPKKSDKAAAKSEAVPASAQPAPGSRLLKVIEDAKAAEAKGE